MALHASQDVCDYTQFMIIFTEYWAIILMGLGEIYTAQYIDTILLTQYY